MAAFINTKKYLFKYGEQVVNEMKTRLTTLDKIATGKLINSLGYKIKVGTDEIEFDFTAVNYYKYVDKGRRPGKRPPLKKIEAWCRVKGIPKKAAYPIAKKIGERGIKLTNFYTLSTTRRLAQFTKNVQAAYKMDVEGAINEVIREIISK